MEIAGGATGSKQTSPSDHERSGKPTMEGMQQRRRPARSNQMSMAFERQVFERRSEEGRRLSCTLITGFLGSGKTTLVRHILQHRAHLRIAVLVNDYADLDIDSLLLDTRSVNSAFGLPSVSLVNGCACCNVSGKFKEAVSKVVRSKHNFDYLIIETSGLADPVKVAKDLRGMGVQLDVIVTVVDVEALDKVVRLPIALEQLTIADVVLVNKCDLASLGAISDVENLIDRETKGSKAVRCRFCKVPLELILNLSNSAPIPSVTTSPVKAFAGVLSHETCSGSAYLRPSFQSSIKPTSKATLGTRGVDTDCAKSVLKQGQDALNSETHSLGSIASLSFSSSVPLLMTKVQSIITDPMFHTKGLVRAKGVLWLNENRRIRLIFHWSGKKRCEATYGGQWECPPFTSLIFIGLDKDELDLLKQAFTNAQVDLHPSISNASSPEQGTQASQFADIVAADTRFKVCRGAYQSQGQIAANDAQACVTFGLVGSPLRGVSEADLNQALMHAVNAQGILFLTAVTSSREDLLLQVAIDKTNANLETIWKELSTAATSVRAKFFKNVHNCSCDMKDHNH